MNVRWGKFIEDDELPSLEDVLEDEDEEGEEEEDDDDDDTDEEESDDEESDDDEDGDDDQEDDDDDEEDEEDDDEEVEPVVRGTTVTAKPGRAKKASKYKVKSSNKSRQTCTLIRVSDKREFKDQPWSCVE